MPCLSLPLASSLARSSPLHRAGANRKQSIRQGLGMLPICQVPDGFITQRPGNFLPSSIINKGRARGKSQLLRAGHGGCREMATPHETGPRARPEDPGVWVSPPRPQIISIPPCQDQKLRPHGGGGGKLQIKAVLGLLSKIQSAIPTAIMAST